MKKFLLYLIASLISALSYAGDFEITEIPDAVWARMQGKSYPKGCSIPRSELRYLTILHYDTNGSIRHGELVCNRVIAQDLISIFRQLYNAKYQIESVRLIDDFDADDQASMTANNTSCFCYRTVQGTPVLSAHSRGMAIDINPLYNPCVYKTRGTVAPKAGSKYAYNRDARNDIPMKIDRQDLCYTTFIAHGFKWGGAWARTKDYQHFEK